MKRFFILAGLLGLAMPFVLVATSPAMAGGKSAKAYHGKTYVVRRGLFGRRRVVVVKPRVKGFTARVGGYSFNVGATYSYDPIAPQPRDFGPQHDFSPSQHGIIPTGLY